MVCWRFSLLCIFTALSVLLSSCSEDSTTPDFIFRRQHNTRFHFPAPRQPEQFNQFQLQRKRNANHPVCGRCRNVHRGRSGQYFVQRPRGRRCWMDRAVQHVERHCKFIRKVPDGFAFEAFQICVRERENSTAVLYARLPFRQEHSRLCRPARFYRHDWSRMLDMDRRPKRPSRLQLRQSA